jgi:hypothetical protein
MEEVKAGRAPQAAAAPAKASLFLTRFLAFLFLSFCPPPPPPLCLDQLIIWSPLKRRPPPAPPRDHGENGQARGGAHRRGWINGFQLRRGGGRAPLS